MDPYLVKKGPDLIRRNHLKFWQKMIVSVKLYRDIFAAKTLRGLTHSQPNSSVHNSPS